LNVRRLTGHIHISLRDSNGKNIFASERARTDAKWPDLKHVSKDLEHFLAGILKGLPDIMPCLVPTINGFVFFSYNRMGGYLMKADVIGIKDW